MGDFSRCRFANSRLRPWESNMRLIASIRVTLVGALDVVFSLAIAESHAAFAEISDQALISREASQKWNYHAPDLVSFAALRRAARYQMAPPLVAEFAVAPPARG